MSQMPSEQSRPSNVHQFSDQKKFPRPPLTTGNGGNNNSDMEARISKIETRLDGMDARLNGIDVQLIDIKSDMREIRSAVQSMPKWFIGMAVAVVAAICTVSVPLILHESNRNWEVTQKALDRATDAAIRVEALRLAQEQKTP